MPKHYTTEQKRDIAKVISNIAKTGAKAPEIVKQRNEVGAPTASGRPWTISNLNAFRYHYRRYFMKTDTPIREYRKRRTVAVTDAKPVKGVVLKSAALHTIMSILTDSTRSDSQIVKTLTVYLQG